MPTNHMYSLLHKRVDVSVYYALEKINYAKRNRVQFPFFPFRLNLPEVIF
jgi:hypothetical protein